MKPRQTRGAARAAAARSEKRATGFRIPRPRLLAAVGLLLLTLLAFSNSFQGGFVLDNKGLLLNDPRLREATSANLRLILQHTYWWPTGEGGVYRPFTTLSYLFNYAILGNREQPAGYHWLNFLLHAGNVLLVYALARRFIRGFWPPLFVAAIWAVHPVQTESVTNMVGRADLLAAAGLLAGFLLYLKSVEASGRRRVWLLAALAAVTFMGALSKENAVVLPGAIVVYELVFRKEKQWGRAQIMGLLAVLAPIALMLYQRSVVLAASLPKEVPFVDNPILGADFWTGRLTGVKVLARYLALVVWPARLSVDYSWSQIPIVHGSWQDWVACLIVPATVAAVAFAYRTHRGVFFLFCLGAIWLAPVANIVFPIGTMMAERFLYVPVLGVAACVVALVHAAAQRLGSPRYAPAVLGVMTAALMARTWVRNSDWNDDLSMATATVQASPGSYKSHDLLANVLFASDPSHANIDRVIAESEKSLAILDPLPDSRNVADPYQFAATCYMYRGAYSKAIPVLLRFLAVDKAGFADVVSKLKTGGLPPQSVARIGAERQGNAYTMLSMAYLGAGDPGKAADAATSARALNPVSSALYRQLAEVDLAAGRLDQAAATLIEGAFVTADGSLRQELVDIYRKRLSPGNCALTPGPRGPALNPACPMVHSHICAAGPGTIRTLLGVGQKEQAEARKKMFVTEFGCPREQLDELLP